VDVGRSLNNAYSFLPHNGEILEPTSSLRFKTASFTSFGNLDAPQPLGETRTVLQSNSLSMACWALLTQPPATCRSAGPMRPRPVALPTVSLPLRIHLHLCIQANLISTYHVVFRDLAKRSPERTCDAFENVGFGISPLHSVCLASGARRHGVLVLPLDSEALLRRNRVSHLGFRSFNPQSSYPQGLIVFALGCLFPFLSLLRRLRIRCKCSFRKSCTPIL
jgi:hypothetical protein